MPSHPHAGDARPHQLCWGEWEMGTVIMHDRALSSI